MKADYSRLNFNLDKGYTRVLQQQGRVTLDADWNEQAAIEAALDRLRLGDIIGGCGVPTGNAGFAIVPAADGLDLDILPGTIYVDGLRISIEDLVTYGDQPFWPDEDALPGTPATGDQRVDAVYICVKERHVTYLEDDAIREIALGGPDTTTRVQTTWQVRVATDVDQRDCEEDFADILPATLGGGRLTTNHLPATVEEDPCVTPAESGYRGLENRLYRVEVHQGGTLGGGASVKWSRYNGALAFKVEDGSINTTSRTLKLNRLGWDQIRTLKKNDWVELISEDDELNGVPGALVQIDDGDGAVDDTQRQIRLKAAFAGALGTYASQEKVKVRLWNGEDSGDILLSDHLANPADTRTGTIELEDGITIELSVDAAGDEFRTGDYWTFIARTITGEIDLLVDEQPHGPEVHCCKLALIFWDGATLDHVEDCRPHFPPLTELLNLYYVSGDGQEAMPGETLPFPLVVRANIGEHPVENLPITFEIATPAAGGDLSDGANNGSSLIVLTDGDGFAAVEWQLGGDRSQPNQQVRAFVTAPAGERDHLQVRFNANLSLAEDVSYQPPEDCTNLEGTTTVAEALDALCNISAGEDPGFHITGVFWRQDDAQARHGQLVAVNRLLRGLCVACDAPPDPDSVVPPAFYIQLELPFGSIPLNGIFTIPANVGVEGDERMCWQPQERAAEWMRSTLAEMLIEREAILARLTVKGSSVWHAEDPTLYLDGEVTTTADGVVDHNLNLPSGDGKSGGDFEMWFFLGPNEIPPEPGGTLRWFVDAVTRPDTLDPILIMESQDVPLINLLYAGLVRMGPDLEVLPDLAESWEVSDDGTIYTFFLRPELRFSDESPLTAAAVAFSLDRARSASRSRIGPLYLSNIDGIEVLDDSTLQIFLRQQSRFFLQQLTTPPAKVVHETTIEGNDGIAVAEITSGAFVLADATENTLMLNASKSYWQPAGVGNVEFLYGAERKLGEALYESSEIHVAGSVQTGLSPVSEGRPGFTTSEPSCAIRYLGFVRREDTDARFMRALSFAIDREALLAEGAVPAHRFLSDCIPEVPAPDDLMPFFDPQRAVALLEEMGWVDQDGDGFREMEDGTPAIVNLLFASEGNDQNARVVSLIRDFFADVGIRLEATARTDLRAFSEFLHELAANDPIDLDLPPLAMYYSYWQADYPDPQNILSQQLHTIEGPRHLNNNGHFSNGEFDELVDSGDRQLAGFGDTYRRAEGIALAEGGWITLFHPQPRALIRPGVEGLALTGQGIIVADFSLMAVPAS